MLTVNKHADVLIKEFYLDKQGQVRRANDGYYGRFAKDDLVIPFGHRSGYRYLQVPRQRTTVRFAHLVALLAGMHIPDDKEIDHIDGDRQNNHPSNLRVVDRRTNSCNRKKRSDNTSGITGIRWSDYHQHYVIRRTVKGKRISRSRKTLDEAKQVLAELHSMDAAYTQRHGK